jgi:hypothetical protein
MSRLSPATFSSFEAELSMTIWASRKVSKIDWHAWRVPKNQILPYR